MRKVVVIPARLNSSRLPNKVILDLKGKPVVQRVYERCKKAESIDDVFIATDSVEVEEVCKRFTNNVIMTSDAHQSGTDRIAEAVENIDCDIVINVQGDEPFIDISLIEKLANAFGDDTVMASAMHKVYWVEELKNPNVVKVVVDEDFNAIYFSRSVVPYYRDKWDTIVNEKKIPNDLKCYKHLGVYAYTKRFIKEFSNLEQTYLESIEKLEQLRVLENGYKIKMLEVTGGSIGIDTQADYEAALTFIKRQGELNEI